MTTIAPSAVGSALFFSLLLAVGTAWGQEEGNRCRLPTEENGLIRGDRIPSGCQLVTDNERSARSRPFVVSEETIFYTPNAKIIVLENGFRLSGGRLVIPRVPPGSEAPIDFGSGSGRRGFSPLQRPMGPLHRHFGPIERDFGRAPARPAPRGRGSGKP